MNHFLCLYIVFAIWLSSLQVTYSPQNTEMQARVRYIICGNVLRPAPGPDAVRNICVLMDEDSFGPESLKELFSLLSKRFPEPAVFVCSVKTSLDQLNTPEEEDNLMSLHKEEPHLVDHHHRAIFIRSADNEIIRYTAAPGDTSLKTIVLKGKDPVSKGK
jgi:hypothetical protein